MRNDESTTNKRIHVWYDTYANFDSILLNGLPAEGKDSLSATGAARALVHAMSQQMPRSTTPRWKHLEAEELYDAACSPSGRPDVPRLICIQHIRIFVYKGIQEYAR